MRAMLCAAAVTMAVAANPSLARDQERPITDREVNATDVASTPITDLNLKKDEIPILLIDAQATPYALKGLGKCKALVAEVEKFDAMLGPDLDLPQSAEGRVSPGRVAQSVVGSFIPFRGVIREISGANDQERKLTAAIEAGLARRAFLKGIGAERSCPYPARPATYSDVQAYVAAQKEAEYRLAREKLEAKERKSDDKGTEAEVAAASD